MELTAEMQKEDTKFKTMTHTAAQHTMRLTHSKTQTASLWLHYKLSLLS